MLVKNYNENTVVWCIYLVSLDKTKKNVILVRNYNKNTVFWCMYLVSLDKTI